MWFALYLVQATVFVLYPVIRDLPLLFAAMTDTALAGVGVSPARSACVAHLAGPGGRVRARAQLQAVTNVGSSRARAPPRWSSSSTPATPRCCWETPSPTRSARPSSARSRTRHAATRAAARCSPTAGT